jgi:HEPN domain-containing protein
MNTDIPHRWVEQGLYDLETARAMLQSGRLLYVPFCCQQAVEKVLKGLVAKTTDEMPPRTHNLMQLARMAGLQLDGEQALLMRELSEYYVHSRYPDEVEPVPSTAWQEIAAEVLVRTEKVITWLSSMI